MGKLEKIQNNIAKMHYLKGRMEQIVEILEDLVNAPVSMDLFYKYEHKFNKYDEEMKILVQENKNLS